MIVPTRRLLFWVGAVVLPFSALAGTVPSALFLSVGLMVALFLLALTDALFALGRLYGVDIEFPQVVRLSKGRDGAIELRIQNEGIRVRRLRLGLAFPDGLYSPYQDLVTELPKETPSSSLSWPLKALRQGRYLLENCYLEALSPLGFWAGRAVRSAASEIRVYPNLLKERKDLAALFLNRTTLGIHTQRQIGRGRDFEHLRDYIPSDSFDDIHWKATAKWGRPITKVFQIEGAQELYLIIDASRLSGRSTFEPGYGVPVPTTVLERFITASLILGLAAERQGDLFGILTFSDRVRGFVRARNGKAHYNACRDTLYTLKSQGVSPDFSELFTFITTRIRRRALLIFLTNLDDPILAEGFVQKINLISRRHLVLVNVLTPQGARPLFSSSHVNSVHDLYRHLGGHFLWSSLRDTEKILKRRGVGFSLLDNENMCAQLVSQYLTIKQRQIL